MSTTWTHLNTDGFTRADLAALNTAQAELERRAPEVDPENIADALNNEWIEGASAAELIARAWTRLNGPDA